LQRKNNELDDEMLTLTAELLSNIPEFATLWNIRRELVEDWADNRLHIRFLCSCSSRRLHYRLHFVHLFVHLSVRVPNWRTEVVESANLTCRSCARQITG